MIKRLIIRWALRQIIKFYERKHPSYADGDSWGIEDIMPDSVDPKAIHIVVRKDLSTNE